MAAEVARAASHPDTGFKHLFWFQLLMQTVPSTLSLAYISRDKRACEPPESKWLPSPTASSLPEKSLVRCRPY
ncbi:hypothetical protein EVAR_12021_1 [Eumeta japonica]|uniref:Uncharacterized protein n=1 Tax=Eumeta variegata TaxID=151549 RepID=A0A4C1U588_EUMVA|nr:hypothetical protein EVAR_12021_1 [Eumeta japonica]